MFFPDNNQFENNSKIAFGLTDLIKTQILYIYELTEVIIISKNKDLVFAIF